MRLLYVFTAIIAISLAESDQKVYDDSLAAESRSDATGYNSAPYASWNPQNNWNQPQNYVPPVPSWPQTNPIQPVNYVPTYPANPPVQSDYVPPHNWNPPQHHTTTTPVPVIKNEQHIGDNGSYKYEYQIADGTHVGEEGYFSKHDQSDDSLVKKGWYSYKGADGKTYTVTYWADHTGFHAYGEHLPTPPPIPPAIQASIDQNAKEEAAKAEAEKYKPVHHPVYYDPPQPQNPTYYPTQTQKPIYYPTQTQKPIYYPTQPQNPTYYPPQHPGQATTFHTYPSQNTLLP